MKNPLNLRPFLFLQIHPESGNPIAMRIDLNRVAFMLAAISTLFAALFLGTLLFFRELEINRKLSARMLELEIKTTLSQDSTVASSITQQGAATAPDRQATLSTNFDTQERTPAAVRAKIADLSTSCEEGTCLASVALMPTSPGQASGSLVLVLETEIPRIGPTMPSTVVRKRFFIYPGNESRDEFVPDDLSGVQGKTFQFSHALRTGASFNIGKLLRPLALNLYLMDRDGVIIHHQRKPIETIE
ncbi:MAG: hypothetical protein HY537_07580 [Deltaproteobacteria bacterium]|nr:hypothetical protein [Deltaproteobacteria bacterium]